VAVAQRIVGLLHCIHFEHAPATHARHMHQVATLMSAGGGGGSSSVPQPLARSA